MGEVEVVAAHHERATLRVGDVFLNIDADQACSDVEVEAMARAPIPTPGVLWRKPPVLALAALPGVGWLLPDPWATETISEFERVTGVSVILLRRDDLGTNLHSGDIDLAVTRTRLSLAGVVHTPLFEEDRVAVVPARSPLADLESIDWLELAREPIVVNTVSRTTRPELWPANHRPQRIVTCGNYDEWLELVVTGHGVGTLPDSAARTATHPGLWFVALTGAPSVSIWLAYQPRRSTPWGRRFLTVAIAVRGRLAPSPA